MAFCSNCGAEISENERFCHACGTEINNTITSTFPNRQQEYAGKLIKCPNCGEVLTSFTAICPACGHEINSAQVSKSIKAFINQLDQADYQISISPKSSQKGWSTWSKGKKFWWVIFNLYFACIPLVIYLLMPLLRYNSTPSLTPEEKQKVTLIENYVVPNERESVLESLLFIKAKVEFIASEKINRQSAFWSRLWERKADQVYKKAEILFPGDHVAADAYNAIQCSAAKVKSSLKKRLILAVAILFAFLIFVGIRIGTLDTLVKFSTPLEIPETELSILMPQIENGKGNINTNNSSYFSVEYYGISDSEFENYKQQCKENGYTIDCKNDGSLYDAFNKDGYNIRITHFDSEMHVTITDKMDMWTIALPDTEIANLLPAPPSSKGQITSASETCIIMYVGDTTIDEYNEYVEKCINNGFNQKLSRSDDHFHAENNEGFNVIVEYQGFNTIFVRIDD